MTFDNGATVPVPAMHEGDTAITIEVAQYGVTAEGRAQFSYTVREGGMARVTGRDLFGPATGLWPEAADMAVTLASFLGATYECGEVTEHGESYSPEALSWLETHAERLGDFAALTEH